MEAKPKSKGRSLLDEGDEEAEAAIPLPKKDFGMGVVPDEEVDLGDPKYWKKAIDR